MIAGSLWSLKSLSGQISGLFGDRMCIQRDLCLVKGSVMVFLGIASRRGDLRDLVVFLKFRSWTVLLVWGV